jgi:hypothetical protein
MRRPEEIGYEELLRIERGEPEEYIARTVEQQEQLRKYQELKGDLSQLGEELRAPLGWEAGVWALVGRAKKTPRPGWLLFPAVAVVALLAIVWSYSLYYPRVLQAIIIAPPPGLEISIRDGAGQMRSTQAVIGDTLLIKATAEASVLSVWVYRDDKLLLQCPGASACQEAVGTLTAEHLIPSTGRYRIVYLLSPKTLPPPQGDFDADVAAATAAGGRAKWKFIDVR